MGSCRGMGSAVGEVTESRSHATLAHAELLRAPALAACSHAGPAAAFFAGPTSTALALAANCSDDFVSW